VPQGDAAALPETLDYDLWVTDDNLVRRVVMNVMGMSMQMDYTEWGEPVDIKAPAAADIIKAPAGM
jgi:lipoprotein LprG